MSDDTARSDQEKEGAHDEAAAGSPEKKKSIRKPLLLGLAALVVVAGLIYGAYWYLDARFYVSTADAYVQGNVVMLMPQISGTVTAIRTVETHLVREGEPLVELDPTDKRLALDRAEADLAETVREVRQLYDTETSLKASVASRQSELDQAKRDVDREAPLAARKFIPEAEFQHTQTAYDTAVGALTQAEQQLAATVAAVGTTPPADHPQIEQAEASLRSAYIDLARTTIRAPVTGYVANRTVQLGQEVQPGMPLLAIVPLDQIWIDANFKETSLSGVRLGQPATVHADFYGSGVTFHGRVAGLSAGTGSAFELLPPENATGNWIKIVRRVPVRIELDPAELDRNPLRTGLSTEVSIDIHDTSGPRLDRKTNPDAPPAYETSVYGPEVKGVDALIDHIVRANGIQVREAADAPPPAAGPSPPATTPAARKAGGADGE